MDHDAAAAVPLAALTVWQALVDHASLRTGQHILIHGAAGGVGSFAVQIATDLGARVTATAAGRDRDFVRRLGAHQVIDSLADKRAAYEALQTEHRRGKIVIHVAER